MPTFNYSETLAPPIASTGSENYARESYPVRVAYDAQAFLSANGGTGKGVQLRNLLGPYSESFIGFATPGISYCGRTLVQAGLTRYQLWQQISLPMLLRAWKPDFFLAPYNTAPLVIPKSTRLILVLHDLILLEQFDVSGAKQRITNHYRRWLIPKAVSRSHIILTVSSYTKQQITSRFPGARVQVIPCSIDGSWFVGNAARKLDDRENSILVVTSDVPHKNPRRALEAYAAFITKLERRIAPRLKLVGLSGSADRFRQLAASLQIADLVDIEPYVTEGELQHLYRRSRAVFVPSLMEGFGIPVLEAMASGTPVIASSATSLPEVGGRAAAYFNPHDVAEMAAVLDQVLRDQARQRTMVELGFAQARRFHPDIVGRQVKAFWDKLAASDKTSG